MNKMMGFEILLTVLLIVSYHMTYGDDRKILRITDFLSDSNDADVDHSQAFQAAWKALCAGKGRSIVIHANEKYVIQPQLFLGPCASRNLHIQIDGTIEAPRMIRSWGKSEWWLSFERVSGLVLNGSGLLHAHGESWWPSYSLAARPDLRVYVWIGQAVRFSGCQNILYNGLTQLNSPRNHVSISDCVNATLSNLHLIAPAYSPNTDGIDISLSHHIHITTSAIKTGDDCVAIKGGSYDINITKVACGPGHGISIGSLGKGGANDQVQNVKVRHCIFTGTMFGARIKSWPIGQGFVKNILFEDMIMVNARTPIIIDQEYPKYLYPEPGASNAVKVSDVTYRSFRGTCIPEVPAINLDCDKSPGCENIVMEHINLTSSSPKMHLTSFCRFAHVIARFVSINIKCDFH